LDRVGIVNEAVRPKIVVTGRIPESGLETLRQHGDVWAWPEDELIPTDVRNTQLAEADVAVTLLTDRVDDAFLAAAPRLKVVANVAVGYNNIDVAACTARSITVTNTPGVLTSATADLALGLMLAVTRRLGEGERLIRSGAPWKWGMFMMLGTGLQHRRHGCHRCCDGRARESLRNGDRVPQSQRHRLADRPTSRCPTAPSG
jgi:glyoxylate reductase